LSKRIKDLKSQINPPIKTRLNPSSTISKKQQDDLTGKLENIIKRQTRQVLSEMGIYQPWYKYIKLKIVFPPPEFELETPPHLLVISPRNKIETTKDALLIKDLSLEEMTSIEAAVDKLNVSSLVVDLGGVGPIRTSLPAILISTTYWRRVPRVDSHLPGIYTIRLPLCTEYCMDIT